MNWKKFFKVFFITGLATLLAASLLLGIVGFFLAGVSGFQNGLYWGFIIGLVSIPFTAISIFARFWGDVAGRYGAMVYKEDFKEDDQQHRD